MFDQDALMLIEQSVLCWLATVDANGHPNVSPKEAWKYDAASESILVAHIASPQSVKNIGRGQQVCLSFIEVFLQKGLKVKGTAEVLKPDDPDYPCLHDSLVSEIGPDYPIRAVIRIRPERVEPIIAPSYRLFPDIPLRERISAVMKTYRVRDYLENQAE